MNRKIKPPGNLPDNVVSLNATLSRRHSQRVRGELETALPEEIWFTSLDFLKKPTPMAAPCPILFDACWRPSAGTLITEADVPRIAIPCSPKYIVTGDLRMVSVLSDPLEFATWSRMSPLMLMYGDPQPEAGGSLASIYGYLRDRMAHHRQIWWEYRTWRREAEAAYLNRYKLPRAMDRSLYAAIQGLNLNTWGADSRAMAFFLTLAPLAITTDDYHGWKPFASLRAYMEPYGYLMEDYLRLLRIETK